MQSVFDAQCLVNQQQLYYLGGDDMFEHVHKFNHRCGTAYNPVGTPVCGTAHDLVGTRHECYMLLWLPITCAATHVPTHAAACFPSLALIPPDMPHSACHSNPHTTPSATTWRPPPFPLPNTHTHTHTNRPSEFDFRALTGNLTGLTAGGTPTA